MVKLDGSDILRCRGDAAISGTPDGLVTGAELSASPGSQDFMLRQAAAGFCFQAFMRSVIPFSRSCSICVFHSSMLQVAYSISAALL